MYIKCNEFIYNIIVFALFLYSVDIDFLISDTIHKHTIVFNAYIYSSQCDQQDIQSRLVLIKSRLNT